MTHAHIRRTYYKWIIRYIGLRRSAAQHSTAQAVLYKAETRGTREGNPLVGMLESDMFRGLDVDFGVGFWILMDVHLGFPSLCDRTRQGKLR